MNLNIDAVLLHKAVEASGLDSAEATVEEALKLLIAEGRRARALRNLGGIGWGDNDLDAMREGHADHRRR